jgi:hypothetical protein
MLDPKRYNITALKQMSKERFYTCYSGKIFDIDKVWEWLHPKKDIEEKPKKKKEDK